MRPGVPVVRRPPESTQQTARRMLTLLEPYPSGLTRRVMQLKLFPTERSDMSRAGWIAMAIHYARDRGFLTSYGSRHRITHAGREHLRWAEVFDIARICNDEGEIL